MAQDPLSHVASWLAPVRPDVEDDSVVALAAERGRLLTLAGELRQRAEKIELALPESIAREPLLDAIDQWIRKRVSNHPMYSELESEPDNISETRAKLRASLAPLEEACAVAGVSALKDEAEKLEDQAAELAEQIRATRAISRDGVIAQLAILGQDLDLNGDAGNSFLDVIAEGVKALASPADDSKILSLFREWVHATRTADALYGDDGESEEYKAGEAAVDKIEEAIIETPSTGAVGLAIKSYLLHHIEGGAYGGPALGEGKPILRWALWFSSRTARQHLVATI